MSLFTFDVIIVGGGPAGASCAYELNRHGIRTLILDKQKFPRMKLCAGWLPPHVFETLGITPETYPRQLTLFKRLMIHLCGLRFPFYHRQYAIRRVEFDNWLLKRSGVPVIQHKVQKIQYRNHHYIVDDQYLCRYLVGAGGTHCPVYRTFFTRLHPRSKDMFITTIEEEFPYHFDVHDCHLWFFENHLPGYAWYIPKKGGYVNVGVGGAFHQLKQKHTTIRRHWDFLITKLYESRIITDHDYHPRGYNYYLRQPTVTTQSGSTFIIGDAAGLATLDMGEGIGPAIESGQAAARAIINASPYSPRKIRKFSGPCWLSSRILKIGSVISSGF